MNKILKALGIGVASLAVLGGALMILVNVLITPERLRAELLPLAQQALGREIQLADIDVSIFSGIRLHEIRILDPQGASPVLAAEEIVLRYQFWPLLLRRIVVDEILVEQPRLTLVRQADGRFNFSDLAQDKSGVPVAASLSQAPRAVAEQPLDLLIAKVVVRGGEIEFVDHQLHPQAPYRYLIRQFDFQASDISRLRDFPFSLKALLNDAPLAVEGTADPQGQGGQARLRLNNFDPVAFLPYFRDRLPGRLGAATVDLDLWFEGDRQVLTSHGELSVRHLDLTLEALPEAPLHDARVELDYAVRSDFSQHQLLLTQLTVDLNGIPLGLTGEVDRFNAEPQLDLELVLRPLDLRTALGAVPKPLIEPLKEFDPAGQLSARVILSGAVGSPRTLLKTGELHLEGVQASFGEGRPALTGRLLLEGDRLWSEQLQLALADTVAHVDLKVDNLFDKPIELSSVVRADRFQLDPLLKATATPAVVTAQGSKSPPRPSAAGVELGPFDLPLVATGEVQIKQALYRGLNVDNFSLSYRLHNNMLTVDSLSGETAGGRFNQTGTVDLGKKGLAYHSRIELDAVQIAPLIQVFAPQAAGTIFGGITLEADFSGNGTRSETIRKNLSGDGSLTVADARLTGSALVQGLADYVRLDELRDLRFSQAQGNYRIAAGRVNITGELTGSQAALVPSGVIGLDGGLDLRLGVRLAPELTRRLDRKGEVSQFFTDPQGWGVVPLKVAGTLGKPKFSLDSKGVKGQVKEQIRDELQRKLDDKIFKPRQDGSVDPAAAPAKKLLDEALKGLFGK